MNQCLPGFQARMTPQGFSKNLQSSLASALRLLTCGVIYIIYTPYYTFYMTWNLSQPPTLWRDLADNNLTSRRHGAVTPPQSRHGPATEPNPDGWVIDFRYLRRFVPSHACAHVAPSTLSSSQFNRPCIARVTNPVSPDAERARLGRSSWRDRLAADGQVHTGSTAGCRSERRLEIA